MKNPQKMKKKNQLKRMEPGESKPVLRRCVSCRKVLDRKLLLKVTRDHRNGIVVNGGIGRSAYLCPNNDCLDQSWRRKRLQKSLRCNVPENVMELMQKLVKECNPSDTEAR